MLQDKRVLLTGGAGFIGTHLACALAEHNDGVVLDNLRRNALTPAGIDPHARVTRIAADVLDG